MNDISSLMVSGIFNYFFFKCRYNFAAYSFRRNDGAGAVRKETAVTYFVGVI